MSTWRAVAGVRMVGLRQTVSRQIIVELARLVQHCKGQDYPKMRFPENGLGVGLGTQVVRWMR